MYVAQGISEVWESNPKYEPANEITTEWENSHSRELWNVISATVELFTYPVSTTGIKKRHMKWEKTVNGEKMTVCKETDVGECFSLHAYPIIMGLGITTENLSRRKG
jgi:hypothetical protein